MAGYYRRVIRITADDSPNVKLGKLQVRLGKEVTHEILIPGVLPYADYLKREALWDEQRKCVSLHAQFWEGREALLYPPLWLDAAKRYADELKNGKHRVAKGIGIDPAEGGDNTAMSAVDEFGLIERVSKKTPDTSVVVPEALAFMRKHGAEPHMVVFDRGGGGLEHADTMRKMGYKVRSIGFGETVTPELKRGTKIMAERVEAIEERYVYKNRRAQLYWELRHLMDMPAGRRFALDDEEIRRQLSPIPVLLDEEGRCVMLPKRRTATMAPEKKTLQDLIGCSPDEADSLVLAVHGMLHKGAKNVAGAF